jgi:hypothetical protein
MGEPAKKDDLVAIPRDALERMLGLMARHTAALEQLAQTEKRKLAQSEDNARRAISRAGPTTAEAEARVALRHKKLGV